jgi:amidase
MSHAESPRQPQSAHAFDDDLARLDAVATAEAVRAGRLHPREVVAAAIARAEALEPFLRAVEAADYDRAIAASESAASGPFAGVPTFIKDMVDVAGLATRWGTRALEHAGPATKTERVAAQMFDMGMICLGKSTLPEMGFVPSTEFPHREPTCNPWNLGHSAGGSSGGAAALVAAGVVPIAHAADGGGSIRIPAAVCGLVGLKPSRGRLIPPPGPQLEPVQVTAHGVVTRSVRDTALYYAEAEKRYRNRHLAPIGHVTTPPARRLRIGALIESPSGYAVDTATRRAFDEAVALLQELRHVVEPTSAPVTAQFGDDFTRLFSFLAFMVRAGGRRLFDASFDPAKLTDLTHGLAARFKWEVLATPGAIIRLRRSAHAYARMFERYDVLVSPVVTHVAPPLGHLSTREPFDVLYQRMLAWLGYTPLANATGAPSISLPLGFDISSHLPVGMMFSAAVGQEALLLHLALELESARPWPTLAACAASVGTPSIDSAPASRGF